MISSHELNEVRTIMAAFAERTGLHRDATSARRYLWTDAFAVCNFLSLFQATTEHSFLDLAIRLIDQVHETLGRHRDDDARSGWISGLNEDEGRLHPTVGGLRIGKRLNERPAGRPQDQREEWDRDGQYFHYLTKWMHALARTAVVTRQTRYMRWALELAQAAHGAFVYAPARGAPQRMYWKMSIDLSRPQVESMGHHDPLDALVTYSELDHCRAALFPVEGLDDLQAAIIDAAEICDGRSWVTDDPLGIGGMLTDINAMSQLRATNAAIPARMLSQLMTDTHTGLAHLTGAFRYDASADRRLAFRELGLAIGLHAVEALYERWQNNPKILSGNAVAELEALARYVRLAESIETFWRNPANQSAATWHEHRDINSVMLATSLLPGQFLAAEASATASA